MFDVILPALDDDTALARSLAALVPALAAGALGAVTVADASPDAGMAELADAAGCHHVAVTGGWGAQVQAGLDAAGRGGWVLMLKPGCLPEERWWLAMAAFAEAADAAGRRDLMATFRRRRDPLAPQGLRALLAEFWPATGLMAANGLVLHRTRWAELAAGGAIATADAFIRRAGHGRIRTVAASALPVA